MSSDDIHVAAGDMPIPKSSDPSPKTPPARGAETTAPPPGDVPEMPNVPQPGGLPPADGPNALHVTIKLDDLLWDPERGVDLSGRIAQEAAEQLLSGFREEMLAQTRTIAMDIFREKATEMVTAMLTEAVEKAIQGTDYYGQPKGGPTTLHEVIVKRAEATLRERRENRGGYSRNAPLIEDIISSEIEQAWRRDLEDVIAEARTEVRDLVKDQAAQIIADTIAKSVPR